MKTLSMSELHSVVERLKAEQVKAERPQKTSSSGELVLDVRTPGEFASGHVPGAMNIPVDSIMGKASSLKDFETVYIYCRSGGRAAMAVQILESMGLRNLMCVDCGGMPDWDAAGYPSEK